MWSVTTAPESHDNKCYFRLKTEDSLWRPYWMQNPESTTSCRDMNKMAGTVWEDSLAAKVKKATLTSLLRGEIQWLQTKARGGKCKWSRAWISSVSRSLSTPSMPAFVSQTHILYQRRDTALSIHQTHISSLKVACSLGQTLLGMATPIWATWQRIQEMNRPHVKKAQRKEWVSEGGKL